MTPLQLGFMDKCAKHNINSESLLKVAQGLISPEHDNQGFMAGLLEKLKYEWESIDPDTRNYLVGALGGAAAGGIGGAFVDGGQGALAGALGGAALGTGGAALYNKYEKEPRSVEDVLPHVQRYAPRMRKEDLQGFRDAQPYIDSDFGQWVLGDNGPGMSAAMHGADDYRSTDNMLEMVNAGMYGHNRNLDPLTGEGADVKAEAIDRLLRNLPANRG